MKFTHYDYKWAYYLPSASNPEIYEKKAHTSNQRSEINLDAKYYTSFISIYTKDTQIEKFNFGISAPVPRSAIKSRCEDRLYLHFIIKGKGLINGEPFSAGQFYYTVPLENHTIYTDENQPFVSTWMSVTGTYTQYIINELNKKSKHKIIGFESPSDVMELTKTFLYNTSLGETSTSYLKNLINIFLSYVVPDSISDEAPEEITSEKAARLIQESQLYVRKNLKHVTVADMAAAQHYNTKYFSRIFTTAMGIKPFEYITDCKMEWAKNSLTHSNLSIAEITEAIGYEHRNGFIIAFKKKYGCTPTEYRRNSQQEND